MVPCCKDSGRVVGIDIAPRRRCVIFPSVIDGSPPRSIRNAYIELKLRPGMKGNKLRMQEWRRMRNSGGQISAFLESYSFDISDNKMYIGKRSSLWVDPSKHVKIQRRKSSNNWMRRKSCFARCCLGLLP